MKWTKGAQCEKMSMVWKMWPNCDHFRSRTRDRDDQTSSIRAPLLQFYVDWGIMEKTPNMYGCCGLTWKQNPPNKDLVVLGRISCWWLLAGDWGWWPAVYHASGGAACHTPGHSENNRRVRNSGTTVLSHLGGSQYTAPASSTEVSRLPEIVTYFCLIKV